MNTDSVPFFIDHSSFASIKMEATIPTDAMTKFAEARIKKRQDLQTAIRNKDYVTVLEFWPDLEPALRNDVRVDSSCAFAYDNLCKALDSTTADGPGRKAMKREQFKAYIQMKVNMKKFNLTKPAKLEEELKAIENQREAQWKLKDEYEQRRAKQADNFWTDDEDDDGDESHWIGWKEDKGDEQTNQETVDYLNQAWAKRQAKQAKYGKYEFWMSDSSSGRSSENDEPEQRYLMPWDDPNSIKAKMNSTDENSDEEFDELEYEDNLFRSTGMTYQQLISTPCKEIDLNDPDPMPDGFVNATVDFKSGVIPIEPSNAHLAEIRERAQKLEGREPGLENRPSLYDEWMMQVTGEHHYQAMLKRIMNDPPQQRQHELKPYVEPVLGKDDKDPLAQYKRAYDPDREIVMYEHPDGRTEMMSQREAWAQDELVEKMADPNYGKEALEEVARVLNERMMRPIDHTWLTDAYYGRDALAELMREYAERPLKTTQSEPPGEDRTVIWAEENEEGTVLTEWSVPTDLLPPAADFFKPIETNEMSITIAKYQCSLCSEWIFGTYYKCLDCKEEKEVLLCSDCETNQAYADGVELPPGHTTDHVLAKIRRE